MFRSLFLRGAAVVASLIFLVSPAFAGFDSNGIRGSRVELGMDLTRPRVWADQTCTDSFGTPATNEGAVNVLANVDTMEEAINPDNNIGNATQTGGSADGWCDSTPWVMRGTLTMGASQNVFFGPFYNTPKQGFILSYDFDAIITNYRWWIGHRSGLNVTGSVGVFTTDIGQTVSTTLGPIQHEITPGNAGGPSQYGTFDNAWFVQGRKMYLNLATTGAGVFTFGLETIPVMPYYEEQ